MRSMVPWLASLVSQLVFVMNDKIHVFCVNDTVESTCDLPRCPLLFTFPSSTKSNLGPVGNRFVYLPFWAIAGTSQVPYARAPSHTFIFDNFG